MRNFTRNSQGLTLCTYFCAISACLDVLKAFLYWFNCYPDRWIAKCDQSTKIKCWSTCLESSKGCTKRLLCTNCEENSKKLRHCFRVISTFSCSFATGNGPRLLLNSVFHAVMDYACHNVMLSGRCKPVRRALKCQTKSFCLLCCFDCSR